MKIKGAIFDMDGTLIDSLGIWDIFWDGIGKKFMNDDNFVPDAELDRTCRTTVFSKDIELIREFYSIAYQTLFHNHLLLYVDFVQPLLILNPLMLL